MTRYEMLSLVISGLAMLVTAVGVMAVFWVTKVTLNSEARVRKADEDLHRLNEARKITWLHTTDPDSPTRATITIINGSEEPIRYISVVLAYLLHSEGRVWYPDETKGDNNRRAILSHEQWHLEGEWSNGPAPSVLEEGRVIPNLIWRDTAGNNWRAEISDPVITD